MKEGKAVLESCTILNAVAGRPVPSLQDRMPLILEPEDFALWRDLEKQQVEALREPAAPGVLAMYPVSSWVNKAGNEGARCR